MAHEVTIEEFNRNYSQGEKYILIDVRSENEFMEGTIPGAFNIPIFDNEERIIIGTIYTQDSPKKARELGLEIASRKLPDLYKQVDQIAGKRPIVLFCWRGGMRSKSLAVVLDLMGLPVLLLNGGYKAYRRHIINYFAEEFPYQVIVLRGNTGTGKTELLLGLEQEGYPVIDLEGLSNNRGSVFGYIGQAPQPSQKQFEALLYDAIMRYREHLYLLMECESKRIGRLTLPKSIITAMKEGIQVLLYDSIENRVNRLVKEYATPEFIQELKRPLERLKKRLGKESLDQLVKLLEIKNYPEFAKRLILEYYDQLYGYPNDDSDQFDFCFPSGSSETSLDVFAGFLENRFPNSDRKT